MINHQPTSTLARLPQCQTNGSELVFIAWRPFCEELGLWRAERWLRVVRDIATTDKRWDLIRWYSYD
jgi:hypothetical protein